MEIENYIEQAAAIVGSQAKLAKTLGISPQNLADAKHHRRPLPLDACVRIASMLDMPAMRVIAANELVTEKKPEKVEFWKNFRSAPVMSLVGTGLSGAAALVTLGNAATTESVTKFVTLIAPKAPVYAALQDLLFVLC